MEEKKISENSKKESSNFKREDIQGWGVDLDVKNRPAYPKKQTPPEGTGAHWEKPEQQKSPIEILRSVERPRITHVFGSTVPPKGLSGVMRRKAFKYGEGSFAHWMILLMADRVNVLEGLMEDLKNKKFPHILNEMGYKAEKEHNPKSLYVKGVGFFVAIGALLFAIFE